MQKRLALPIVALLAIASARAAAEPAEPPPLPDAGQLTELLAAFDVPGIAMTAIDDCRVGETVVAGMADLEAGTPVTSETAFEAASLSKAVFAWLLMSLVEEGVVDLDAPIAASFDYPRIDDKAAYAQITPRMVLTHRTGLPNWVGTEVPFHRRTTPIPFRYAPGTTYTYSGEAFQLLQAFVERQSGKSLQQLFEERLGHVMAQSTFALPLPQAVTPSRGYARASDRAGGRAMTNLYAEAMAASSLVTTAGDYARFLSHVCRREGLRGDTYDEMLRPQSDVPEDAAPTPARYALGWLSMTLPEGEVLGHGGDNDEYRAFAGFFRVGGDGVVILSNGANGEALINAILLPQ